MTKKVIIVGLGSHAALAAIAFMIVAGGLGQSMLAQATIMLVLAGWALSLVFMLLFARLKWDLIPGWQRAGLIALAVPGLTLGFPIVMLYLIQPRNRPDLAGAVD